jgi:trigger factor
MWGFESPLSHHFLDFPENIIYLCEVALEIKLNELTLSEHEVEVTLQYEEIKPEIEEAYKKERKNISLPGFRKGKLPMHMLKKMYGEAIEYQAAEEIANKKFWDVVEAEGLKPISTPQLNDLDFKINEKLFFKVKYEVIPNLELKNYKGVEVEKPIFKVKDEDIDKEVDTILKSRATFEDAEIVEDTFYRITVDLQKLDEEGNAIEGAVSNGMTIDLSDPKVNPEIVKKAKNKKAGSKFKFTFEDEHKHGEEVHKEIYNYSADVKKVEKIVLPEATEELIEELSGKQSKTLAEFKSQIKDNFEKYYEGQSENIVINSLLSQIVENNSFDPPAGYVEVIEKRLLEQEKENAKKYNALFNEDMVKENIKPRAIWNSKWQIILENICKAENIEVTDSELEELAGKEAENTGISKEKLIKYYKDIKQDEVLREEKVIKFLKDSAKIIEVDPEKKLKETKKSKEAKETKKPKEAKETKKPKDAKETKKPKDAKETKGKKK